MISAYPELEVAGRPRRDHQARTTARRCTTPPRRKDDRNLVGDRQVRRLPRHLHRRWRRRAASRRCGGARSASSKSKSATGAEPLTLRALAAARDRLSVQASGALREQRRGAESHLGHRLAHAARRRARNLHGQLVLGAAAVHRRHAARDADHLRGVGRSRASRSQAIEAFAESDVDGGLVQGAYPVARCPMSSPRFRSPGWACSRTGRCEQPDRGADRAPPAAHAPGARAGSSRCSTHKGC